MSKEILYKEIVKHVQFNDKPFHWINRNLTVVAQGTIGLHFISIVKEEGFDGELTDSGVLIYTQRGEQDVSESTI